MKKPSPPMQSLCYYKKDAQSDWAGPVYGSKLPEMYQKGLLTRESMISDISGEEFVSLADIIPEPKKNQSEDLTDDEMFWMGFAMGLCNPCG